jgi:hypothetical protein
MSRKTMDEYDTPLSNIYPPPRTTHPQNDDTRAQNLIKGDLSDERVTAAYNVPWRDAGKLAPVANHLESAEEDFRDAVWGVSEGKRDVRNLRTLPEFSRR